MSYTELMTAAFCQTRRRARCRNQLLTVHSTTARRVSGSTFLSTSSKNPVAPKAVVTNTPFKIRDMLARVPESDKGVQGQPSVSHNHVKTSISTSHVALSIGEWGRRQPLELHRYHLTGIILTSPILAKAR